MGYRSDVALGLRKVDFEELMKRVELIEKQDVKKEVIELIKDGKKNIKQSYTDFVVLYWESIKWYENMFPEIKFIMNFIEDLEEYDYVRIGEDTDDITEELYSGHYLCTVSRSIDF